MTADEAQKLTVGEHVTLAPRVGGKPTFGRVESVTEVNNEVTVGIKWDNDGSVSYYDPSDMGKIRKHEFRSRLSRADALDRLSAIHEDDV